MGRADQSDVEQTRILLSLLDSVEKDGGQTQRRLAAEVGIAVGLANSYIKRCVKKGLLKIRQAPRRRYAYYLTPQGFAEKSRLTVEYLSYSLGFFREAKSDIIGLLKAAENRKFKKVVLIGCSDLAEIAVICAADTGIEIVAVVDTAIAPSRLAGVEVLASFDAVPVTFDAVIVTDLVSGRKASETAIARFGHERVFVPDALRVRTGKEFQAVQVR
ncbi:MAG: winged helix-turn-helix transcriptional regulator [Pseudomonadota bacterium]